MSEKEKMLRGDWYHPLDQQLLAERKHAKALVYQFNQSLPIRTKQRKGFLKQLLGATGKLFHIEQPFFCDYGYHISLGENFFANTGLTILDSAPVHIGQNVCIGPNVGIYTSAHPIEPELRATGLERAQAISIGDDVWIGGNCVINPGVQIGAGSVIGSGSVVTRDIPAGVVAAGNPCRVIRKITKNLASG